MKFSTIDSEKIHLEMSAKTSDKRQVEDEFDPQALGGGDQLCIDTTNCNTTHEHWRRDVQLHYTQYMIMLLRPREAVWTHAQQEGRARSFILHEVSKKKEEPTQPPTTVPKSPALRGRADRLMLTSRTVRLNEPPFLSLFLQPFLMLLLLPLLLLLLPPLSLLFAPFLFSSLQPQARLQFPGALTVPSSSTIPSGSAPDTSALSVAFLLHVLRTNTRCSFDALHFLLTASSLRPCVSSLDLRRSVILRRTSALVSLVLWFAFASSQTCSSCPCVSLLRASVSYCATLQLLVSSQYIPMHCRIRPRRSGSLYHVFDFLIRQTYLHRGHLGLSHLDEKSERCSPATRLPSPLSNPSRPSPPARARLPQRPVLSPLLTFSLSSRPFSPFFLSALSFSHPCCVDCLAACG